MITCLKECKPSTFVHFSSQTPKMKFVQKGPVNNASCSFAFDTFKAISHNTALQVPFSLGLFIFFVFSHGASNGRQKKSVKQQTSQS